MNPNPPPSLPLASAFFASSRLCCSRPTAEFRLWYSDALRCLAFSLSGECLTVTGAGRTGRDNSPGVTATSCTQARTLNVPTPPKRQPLLLRRTATFSPTSLLTDLKNRGYAADWRNLQTKAFPCARRSHTGTIAQLLWPRLGRNAQRLQGPRANRKRCTQPLARCPTAFGAMS